MSVEGRILCPLLARTRPVVTFRLVPTTCTAALHGPPPVRSYVSYCSGATVNSGLQAHRYFFHKFHLTETSFIPLNKPKEWLPEQLARHMDRGLSQGRQAYTPAQVWKPLFASDARHCASRVWDASRHALPLDQVLTSDFWCDSFFPPSCRPPEPGFPTRPPSPFPTQESCTLELRTMASFLGGQSSSHS